MERSFWRIEEVCQYLNVKRSTAYSLVESGSIPFYRIGRLLRFKPEDVKSWMETRRSNGIDTDKKAKVILKAINRPIADINHLVKKSIAEVKGNGYTASHRETRPIRGLREEVQDGVV
jgi:excisionase family DNA binding protein